MTLQPTRQITLGQMVERITDELSRPDLENQTMRAIQDAIRKHERRFNHFTERRHGRITLIPGQTWYHELTWARDVSYSSEVYVDDRLDYLRGSEEWPDIHEGSYDDLEPGLQTLVSHEQDGGVSLERYDDPCEDDAELLDDHPWSFDEPILNGTVSDIIKVHMTRLVYGENRDWCVLRQMRYREFEHLRADHGDYGRDRYGRRRGENWFPGYWCQFGHQIGIYPTPDCPQTLLLTATARPFMPTHKNHCCVFFDEAEELIRCEAKERIYRHVIRDTESAEEMKREAMIAKRDLDAETVRRTTTQRVRPTTWCS